MTGTWATSGKRPSTGSCEEMQINNLGRILSASLQQCTNRIQQIRRVFALQKPAVGGPDAFARQFGKRRKDNDRYRWTDALQFASGLDAIHPRKPVIHYYRIDRLRLKDANAFFSGVRGRHLVSGRLQQ